MNEPDLRALLAGCGFTVANLSYRLDADDSAFEYRMVIRTTDGQNLRRLAERLTSLDRVLEFRISPTGD
jgi:putative Mg2+ transporter-C (MgtC) family protein